MQKEQNTKQRLYKCAKRLNERRFRIINTQSTFWSSPFRLNPSHLESGYLVRVARLLVYMCPPTSMCTGALDLVSWAGRGIPWAARGETGDRVRDSRDMLRPSWKQVYRKAMGVRGRVTPEASTVILHRGADRILPERYQITSMSAWSHI